jgi:hypothetical protein
VAVPGVRGGSPIGAASYYDVLADPTCGVFAFRDTISEDVEIASSARRHQQKERFDDADIEHVVEHALYVGEDGEEPDLVLYLGPDRAGRLLEVVVVERDDGSEVAIHAMKMRARYEPLLRGSEVADD